MYGPWSGIAGHGARKKRISDRFRLAKRLSLRVAAGRTQLHTFCVKTTCVFPKYENGDQRHHSRSYKKATFVGIVGKLPRTPTPFPYQKTCVESV